MANTPPSAEQEARSQPHIVQLATLTLPSTSSRIKAHTLCYCPTMDLIAAAMEDESYAVWRLSGGRVLGGVGFEEKGSGAGARQRVGILGMDWKQNGQVLAVACSDDSIRLVSSYSGMVVHFLRTRQLSGEKDGRISCLGWSVNLTDPTRISQHLKQSGGGKLSLDDLLAPLITSSTLGVQAIPMDLPRELALIDVESSFPKLSTLPPSGVDDDVFSSRQSLDAMFHEASVGQTDSVDVLVAGFEDGLVHLKIFDCFEIGSVDVGSVFDGGKCKVLQHASHPMTAVHSLVVERFTSGKAAGGLYIVTMNLRFITASPRYLSVVASKSTQLQNLLRYMDQVQHEIEETWRNAQDLPTKFLRNINETLAEKWECDFITAAYHLVVTGDCYPPLKEFLVDELGERGHKRWEKAMTNGYEVVRRLVHECLLPAIERCQIVVSRLMGLSEFRKAGGVLGLDGSALDAINDTLDCLNLLAHRLLIVLGKEERQFSAFAKWLRLEIDIQATDPDVSSVEDLFERQDGIEHRHVLEYISGAMSNSSVFRYIRRPQQGTDAAKKKDPWQPADPSNGHYKTYKNVFKESHNKDGIDVPKLDDLTGHLQKQCVGVFSQIAETLRRSILMSKPTPISPEIDRLVMDTKMLPLAKEATEGEDFRTLIAAREGTGALAFYEISHPTRAADVARTQAMSVPVFGETLYDIKFVDNDMIMTLSGSNGETAIQSWDYRDLNDLKSETKHVFDITVDKARPIKFEVNGRKGRRVVCVLFDNRRTYKVFDMDNQVETEEEEAEEMAQD